MNLTDLSSLLFTTMRVLGSTVQGPYRAVLVGGDAGIEGFSPGRPGERAVNQTAFGAPGVVFRPRPPEASGYDTLVAEAFSVRTSDGPTPVAWRDFRWNRTYPNPKEGDIAYTGYAGGFLAFEDVAQQATDSDAKVQNQVATIYVPYAKNAAGVATKAHAIVFDPVSESIGIIQGDGYALMLDKDNGIVMRSKTGSSWLSLKDDKFEVVAQTASIRASVALGASPEAGLPLLPGPASQPTPSVFYSPT